MLGPELTLQEHPSVPAVVQMVHSICRWYPFHTLRGKDRGQLGNHAQQGFIGAGGRRREHRGHSAKKGRSWKIGCKPSPPRYFGGTISIIIVGTQWHVRQKWDMTKSLTTLVGDVPLLGTTSAPDREPQ